MRSEDGTDDLTAGAWAVIERVKQLESELEAVRAVAIGIAAERDSLLATTYGRSAPTSKEEIKAVYEAHGWYVVLGGGILTTVREYAAALEFSERCDRMKLLLRW